MIRRFYLFVALSIIIISLTSCIAPVTSQRSIQDSSDTMSNDDKQTSFEYIQYSDTSQIAFKNTDKTEGSVALSGIDNNLQALIEYMSPSEVPQVFFERINQLKYGMTDAEVADVVGCYGKIVGSGVLIRMYNVDEEQEIRLHFRQAEEFNVFRLHRVDILMDGEWIDYDLNR